MPPVAQLGSNGESGDVALTADGEVWTIGWADGTAAALGLSGIVQLTDNEDTGAPDPWYGLRSDGTIVQGTGDAAHPFNEITLPYTDITQIAASRGLWALRSDGTVWSIRIDFQDPDSDTAEATSEGADPMVPSKVRAVPVQGVTDATHLWNGHHRDFPIVQTSDGRLFSLDPNGDSTDAAPIATRIAAPTATLVDLQDPGGTWVGLDDTGQLWFWPAGITDDALDPGAPEPLVGPTPVDGRIAIGMDLVFGADRTMWQLASDSGPVSVQNVTDSIGAQLPLPGSGQVLFYGQSVVITTP